MAAGAGAQEAPPNLARRIAHEESETQAARDDYTYRQAVVFAELDEHGAQTGEYREERDVIFSPEHERTERIIGKPLLIFWSYDAPTADLVDYTADHFIDLAKNFFSKTRWNRTFKLVRGVNIPSQQ